MYSESTKEWLEPDSLSPPEEGCCSQSDCITFFYYFFFFFRFLLIPEFPIFALFYLTMH